jgi:predicted 3-demethylubiquinone-9 3-methyltransferase (glyoxalase superfamily)
MPTISPFLWFDGRLEQAVAFYSSVFPGVTVLESQLYGEGMPGPAGTLMTATLEVAGQRMMGLNGGPEFPFTEAVSMFVACDSQAEADGYWQAIEDGGGTPGQCGWIKDPFGLSWQIVPPGLFDLLGDPDPQAAFRAGQAMLGQSRLDIEAIRRAAHPD